MKIKFLVALLACVVMAVGSSFAQVDLGDPDTLILLTSRPEVGADDSTFIIEAYTWNDQNALFGISAGFSWDNVNLHLDSAVATPLADAAWDNFIFYPNSNIDSANSRRAFGYVGFWFLMGNYLAASSGRQHIGTYYFTLNDWNAGDSIVIDTFEWDPGYELAYQDSATVSDYRPVWFLGDAKIIVRDPSDATTMGSTELPKTYALAQNYPNPFNPTTTIEFDLPVAGEFTLTIYNVLGQVVEKFKDHREAGQWAHTWDASDVASGLYFYKLTVGDFSDTKKMMLLK
jgi:hypothetical protein